MRCPECNLRNSIAARECKVCGAALRRKPLPLGFKIFFGSVIGLAGLLCIGALSTTMDSPEKALNKAAKVLTAKPKSTEETMENFHRFDRSVRRLVEQYAPQGDTALTNKLSAALPKSLYEVHLFELLPNLKMLEIDTALNVANYLILFNNEKAETVPLLGLDVLDSHVLLPHSQNIPGSKTSSKNQLLALIGHTTGMHGRHPKIKTLLIGPSMQADNIIDLTDNMVPKITGEGSARFAANQKDVELSISLLSRGQDLKVFALEQLRPLPIEDETLHEQLIWQNDRYFWHPDSGISKLYAVYAAASALKNHNKLGRFYSYLSNNARHSIERSPTINNDGFTIRSFTIKGAKPATTSNIYELSDGSKRSIIELRKTSGPVNKWIVANIYLSNVLSIAKSNPIPQTKPAPETTQPNDTVTQEPTGNSTPKTAQSQISTPSPSPAPEQTNVSNSKAGLSSKTRIRMRSGPGTNYAVLRELKPTAHIVVINKDNEWYKVKVNGKDGYILGSLLDEIKTSNLTSGSGQSNKEKKVPIDTPPPSVP